MSINKAFRCKNIYTASSPELIDGFVVVNGNKIIAIAKEEEMKKDSSILNNAKIYDFKDNFIMPGFCDYHTHLMSGAMLEQDGILRYTKSEEEAAQLLWNLHKDKKNKKWILGGAWDPILWGQNQTPSKETLDKYFPNVPLFLINKECHGAWVNSKLLDVFNITKDTPDPPNGHYGRNASGDPSGYLHEEAFIDIQNKILSMISDREMADYAVSSVNLANQYGITSVGDVAGVGPLREASYGILENEGKLSLRINFSSFQDEGVQAVKEKMEKYNSPVLKCCGAKTFIDGTPLGYTGYMLEDYSDKPGYKGKPFKDPEKFVQEVVEFDKANVQVRVHACGDGAVRLSLDAFEQAIKENGRRDARHCIEHIESISPDDISRFGELEVIVSVQPEHLPKYDFYNHPFHKMLGEERMNYSWPFESLRKNGALLAFGTDYPVVDLNPFRGIFRAVTRLTNEGEPKGGWNPKERVAIHETLRAYTYGGAYASRRDHELGTLEPGKLADIAIIQKNLFECATDKKEMFEMQVLMTIMNGDIVYKKE